MAELMFGPARLVPGGPYGLGVVEGQAPLQGAVTSVFRSTAEAYRDRVNGHSGVDIGAPAGTPVRAPREAVVRFAGAQTWQGPGDYTWVFGPRAEDRKVFRPGDPYGLGHHVILDHDGGHVATLYAHLVQPSPLRAGQRVRAGEIVGFVGSTGTSTGPHLHWMLAVAPAGTRAALTWDAGHLRDPLAHLSGEGNPDDPISLGAMGNIVQGLYYRHVQDAHHARFVSDEPAGRGRRRVTIEYAEATTPGLDV